MLRSFACRLLMPGSPEELRQLLESVVDLCFERYPFCRRMIVEMVNRRLEKLDVEPLDVDDARDYAALEEKIATRLREQALHKLLPRRASRSEIQQTIATYTVKLMHAVVMAALDVLGVECPITMQKQEQ